MAETDTPFPMTDADIAPPAGQTAKPTAPRKGASAAATPADKPVSTRQVVSEGASSLGQQAADKARLLAEDGKTRATGLLDQFAQMLADAAGQVDDRLGAQYGDHARSAASAVQGFAATMRDKPVDDIADDVRGYIRKSPAAAIGVTAALGFALARMVHAGLDQRA